MIERRVSDRDQMPQRLADRFTVEARLGEGAMGQVFRVHDEHEGRTVALKLLKPERTEPGQLQRFKREFRAAARLHHPYCVHGLDFVEHGGLAMLTMEYVPGGSLVTHRWERPTAVVRLALQLLAGLDHIHGKRLVHRDLKPSNILIEPTAGPPHPRLADFGIADVVELSHEDTAVGMVQGSLRYLAPETLESGAADPRSDLYSLGLILYALLAGQHPFGGAHRSLREWLSIHRRGRMRALSQVRSDLPAGLAEIVHHLCHRRPGERFVDAAAAHDALRALWEREAEDESPPEHPPLLRAPYLAAPAFVGRRAELDALRRVHDRGHEGRGPVVARVVGDAGQGKSRLLRELLVEVLDGDAMVFPGTCRMESHGPYEPLGDLLDALADVDLEGDATPLQMVAPVIQGPGLAGPEDPTADASIVSGSSPAGSMVAELRPVLHAPEDAVSGVLQTHARWAARMRLLARKRSVLLILEDAQWADAATLQLLTTMVRTMAISRLRGDAVRAVFVVSHRRSADSPDLEALFETAAEYEVLGTIDLPPLPGPSGTELLASMLMTRPDEVPAAFGEPLVAQAEGSPLYLAQMLYSLLGRGELHRGPDGRWALESAELSAARLPGSVTRAIGERAARLPTAHKQIMVAAAVLGRRFSAQPLQAVASIDELVLLDAVDELVRAGFVEDHEGGYRFVHDQIRESILEEVPPAELRRLHARAAEHLVEHQGDQHTAWPTIAHHFERAERFDEALEHALRAARHAAHVHAYGAALELHALGERAAARGGLALPDEVWEQRGDAHSALGHYVEAVEAFDRGLGGREGMERASLLSKLGLLEYKQGNFARAIPVLEDVLRALGLRVVRNKLLPRLRLLLSILGSLLPLPRWRGPRQSAEVGVRTRTLLAECYFLTGDLTGSARHSMGSANLARRLGASPESVRALTSHGIGLVVYGQPRLGQRHLQRARAYCQQVDVPESVRCRLRVAEGMALLMCGNTPGALERLEDAWRRYGATPSAEARVHVLTTFTQVLLLTGHSPRRSRHYVRRMQALAEELKDTRLLGAAQMCRGYQLLCEGRLDVALEPLRRGRELSRQAGDRLNELQAQSLLVLALALQGKLDEALERAPAAAEHSLQWIGVRSLFCRDAAAIAVAAEALCRGRTLPPTLASLVPRVLARCRRDALGVPSSAAMFLVAEAVWRRAQGLSHDLQGPIARAEQLGLRGEVALCRLVAARLGTKADAGDDTGPHPLVAAPR